MTTEARRVVFRGRVQGVGFRATARNLATSFSISGYVRNQDDGSVELIVLGAEDEVERFIASVVREFGEKVRSVDASAISPDSLELSGFSIRY